MELSQLLALAMNKSASDIILSVGRAPMLRINGSLTAE